MARRALALLAQAGYRLEGERLEKDGVPVAFEIMVKDRADERLALNYASSLKRIGVDVSVRVVDEVQYQRRRQKFDFDMMAGQWIASASPGNEQRMRWGSSSANQEASYNLCGAASPALDALIEAIFPRRPARILSRRCAPMTGSCSRAFTSSPSSTRRTNGSRMIPG